MTKLSILDWIHRNFAVDRYNESRGEVQFKCPKCGHPRFYFNLNKKVGFCHKARCHFKPSLDELTKFRGSEPSEYLINSRPSNPRPAITKTFSSPADYLHRNTIPLISKVDGKLSIEVEEDVEKVLERNLTLEQIYSYKIRSSSTRIFIPVYEDGVIKNYVSRKKWWFDHPGPKYLYHPGGSIGAHLFAWDEAKHFSYITLVENTFNSIWLRPHINAVATFSANITHNQAELIRKSKCRKVIMLWDEGTLGRSLPLSSHIRNAMGINCSILRITGEPEDYGVSFLREIVSMARLSPERILDMTGVDYAHKG